MNERTELLASLRYLYDALLGIENISAHKQALLEDVNSCQQQIQNEHKRRQTSGNLTSMAKTGANAGRIIGIIVTVIALLFLYAFCGLRRSVVRCPAVAVRL